MIELITVCIVLGLLVDGWFAVNIDNLGVRDGIKVAIGIPVMIATVLAIFIYVGYCFSVVFG